MSQGNKYFDLHFQMQVGHMLPGKATPPKKKVTYDPDENKSDFQDKNTNFISNVPKYTVYTLVM